MLEALADGGGPADALQMIDSTEKSEPVICGTLSRPAFSTALAITDLSNET